MWMNKRVFSGLLVLACGAGLARGQGQPAQIGGFSPDDQQVIQQMTEMSQQIQQRMQQQGIDPQQFGLEMFQQMQSGTFDPADFQQSLIDKGLMDQQMLNTMQSSTQKLALSAIRRQLGSNDEEWNVLVPKLQKIVSALADVDQLGSYAGGAAMLLGGAPASPAAKALRELKTLLKDGQATELQIGIKLRTWRDLHEKAKKGLAGAREDLRGVVTLRQEAVLFSMGILD